MAAHVPEDDAVGKAYDARLVRRLLRYVSPYRTLVFGAVVLIAVDAAMQLAGPLLTRWVIDRVLPGRDAALATRAALLFAALLVAQFGAAFFRIARPAFISRTDFSSFRPSFSPVAEFLVL